MKKNLKKMIIMCVPYFFIGLFATKLGQMWRFTNGTELGEKILKGCCFTDRPSCRL